MKIGLVCPYSVAKGGGVQEYIYALQAELQIRGHDTYIVTPQPRDFTVDARKHIIFIGAATDFRSWGTTMQLSASADIDAIDDMLKREKFDVLHFHEPWVPVLSRQILSRSQAANIATFHSKLPEMMMARTLTQLILPYTKSILKYLDELTAVSEPAAEHIKAITDRQVTIIPNGVDTRFYRPPLGPKKSAAAKTILYVGRFEPRKGVKYLLRAFKVLSEQDSRLRLVLVGDSADRPKMELLAENLEIPEDRITFTGYLSSEEKLAYLRSADVFCSPALFGESFGIVLVEAMACGLPIVAGTNPGYASVLTGTGSLSLVNPKDTEDFVRRLQVMLHEEPVRKVWQAWAKQTIPRYSYTHIVDQYEALYKRALKKR